MKVRWIGNACVDMISDERVIIDPHPTVELRGKADKILITHEHHFDKDKFDSISEDAEVYAPKHTLDKFNIRGKPVTPGDEFSDIKVLDCECWNSEESVGYYYKGILHPGDAAEFYVENRVLIAFSPCFESDHDDHLQSIIGIDTGMVIPFHYDPKNDLQAAEGLIELLKKKTIYRVNC